MSTIFLIYWEVKSFAVVQQLNLLWQWKNLVSQTLTLVAPGSLGQAACPRNGSIENRPVTLYFADHLFDEVITLYAQVSDDGHLVAFKSVALCNSLCYAQKASIFLLCTKWIIFYAIFKMWSILWNVWTLAVIYESCWMSLKLFDARNNMS